jgi:sulfotransferase
MKQKIFFQSSLPRAGSTLMQNIVAQNPNFYSTPTSGVIELLASARNYYTHGEEFKAQDSEIMKKAFQGFCKGALHSYFEAITDKPYVLDKSRGWGYLHDFLDFFHPNPKIVCMIRDPRAVFASMEKNYRKHPDKSIMFGDLNPMETITTENRITFWSNNPPVGMSLQRLHECIRQGIDKKMLFIKYENLVRNPQEQMKRVYEYLEVDYYEHNFNDISQVTQEDDRVYGIFGDHVIQNQLNIHTPDYEQVLGPVACEWIRNNYSWFYDYFQYK